MTSTTDPAAPENLADHVCTLRVPLESVPEGAVVAVTLYPQRSKRGRARVYRDEVRRHNGQPAVSRRAAKVKFGDFNAAVAALPDARRAVACELIAAVLREPWAHSWASMLSHTEAHAFERVGFWTARIREGRLGAPQRHVIAKLFYDEPLLGCADRTMILDYVEQHHQADAGVVLADALDGEVRCPLGVCSLLRVLHAQAPTPYAGWIDTDTLFDAIAYAATCMCASGQHPIERPAPPGRLTGAPTNTLACPGLAELETRLAEWARVTLRGYSDPAEPSTRELEDVEALLMSATRELLWQGAIGAEFDTLQKQSYGHRAHLSRVVHQMMLARYNPWA